MNHYFVIIDLLDVETEGFLALIPRQRKYVDALMGEGKIVHYALAADRSKLWTTILAESEEKALASCALKCASSHFTSRADATSCTFP
jgi:hypothetical protein